MKRFTAYLAILILILAAFSFGQFGTVSVKTADYAVLPTDHGSIIIMNSASARTVYLPGPSPAQIGMTITIQKRGAGNLTIQAAAADYIADSGVGQYIRNTTAGETYASITLVYAQANRWQIQAASGTWSTDTSSMLFGADTKAQIDTKAPIASPSFTGTVNGLVLTKPAGDRNVLLGDAAFSAWTSGASDNTAVGSSALKAVTSGDRNTAIGSEALKVLVGGQDNVGAGYQSLYKITEGSTNVSVGSGALYEATTGNGNVAVGAYALDDLATGSYNVAIGSSALDYATGDNGIGIGYQALYKVSTGPSNIGIGYRILRNLTTGQGNIGIGYSAGYGTANDPVTDTYGILIGYNANRSVVSATPLTNYVGIGYGTLIDKSNQAKIGNTSITETQLYGSILGYTGGDASFTADEVHTSTLADTIGGMLTIFDSTNGKVGIYRIEGGTITLISGNAIFALAKDNASTINIYYEANVIKIQNKTAGTISVKYRFDGIGA